MKAIKLKLAPSKTQYRILNEMFGKWASICNRYNKYSKTLDENDIKEKLKPKENLSTIQFSQTQTNQQAKKDNADHIRGMQKLGEQKKDELRKSEERKLTISDALKNRERREINPQKPSAIRPRGWFKFHTHNYWNKEIERLDRQIKKKQKTIEKIEKGIIYFKPKKISLWSNCFRINFKQNKLLLKPSINKELIIPERKITEKIGEETKEKNSEEISPDQL